MPLSPTAAAALTRYLCRECLDGQLSIDNLSYAGQLPHSGCLCERCGQTCLCYLALVHDPFLCAVAAREDRVKRYTANYRKKRGRAVVDTSLPHWQ